MQPEKIIKVGIGVYVLKGGKILLGKRKGGHGSGEFAAPGGHLEHMESFEDCARREVKEETGMEIQNIRFVRLLNLKTYPPKHYIHITLMSDWKKGVPKVMEPEKCESWNWFAFDSLPEPRFATLDEDIEAYKTGKNYYDN